MHTGNAECYITPSLVPWVNLSILFVCSLSSHSLDCISCSYEEMCDTPIGTTGRSLAKKWNGSKKLMCRGAEGVSSHQYHYRCSTKRDLALNKERRLTCHLTKEPDTKPNHACNLLIMNWVNKKVPQPRIFPNIKQNIIISFEINLFKLFNIIVSFWQLYTNQFLWRRFRMEEIFPGPFDIAAILKSPTFQKIFADN